LGNIEYQVHCQTKSQARADRIERKLIKDIPTVVNCQSGGRIGYTNKFSEKVRERLRRLSEDQIKSIKADTRFQKDIAFDHNITQQHVSRIKSGKIHADIK